MSMGAWDVDSFANDTACDWSYGLEEAKDLGYVENTLDAVLRFGKKSVAATLERIVVEPSELLDLWTEGGGDSDGWVDTVAELKGRVAG
jgi:hypothetical protein